ncbi:hypothetical protein QE152_g36529 [Popillia japonica]|uniref:Uncharacterized protein n=1 Tax=Popillia japonica TaxID=7064 RepID=A0AAW1ICM0_POPJA
MEIKLGLKKKIKIKFAETVEIFNYVLLKNQLKKNHPKKNQKVEIKLGLKKKIKIKFAETVEYFSRGWNKFMEGLQNFKPVQIFSCLNRIPNGVPSGEPNSISDFQSCSASSLNEEEPAQETTKNGKQIRSEEED